MIRALALTWMLAHSSWNAVVHVLAALNAGTPHVDAALLIAVAKAESDLWRLAPTSRPHGSHPPFYCGPLQTTANNDAECDEQRFDIRTGYLLGANELEVWLDEPMVGGNVRKALLGYCCGWDGVLSGHCADGYADRVLRVYRELGGEW